MMETKTSLVRQYVSCGNYKDALKICKDWDFNNPTHRDILRRGYDCLLYPEFYIQLGFNPDEEYSKAVDLLKTLYT